MKSKIKSIKIIVEFENSNVISSELDDEQEYYGLLNTANNANLDPIEAINFLLCIGSREINNPNYRIAVGNYIFGY